MKRLLTPPFCAFTLLFLLACILPMQVRATDFDQRMVNLSNRSSAGTGEATQIVGFVIGAGAKKPVLIRGIGPSLSSLGVTDALANPRVDLYNSSGLLIASNDDWSSDSTKVADLQAAFKSTGAFSLNTGTKDSALIANLTEGPYTAMLSSVTGTTGTALLEIYDLSGPARLMNLSARSMVTSNTNLSIGGLVVGNGTTRRLLIRAVGPSLASLGVSNVLADPVLDVRSAATNTTIYSNNDWGLDANAASIASEALRVGAFALQSGSKDAAVIATLQPGVYTVLVSGNNKTSGIALVEVYDLNPDVLSIYNIEATVASTDTSGSAPGLFTVYRTGDTSTAKTVTLTLSGTAVSGTDYTAISTSLTFPANVSRLTIPITALASTGLANSGKTLTATINSNTAYGIGDLASATVTLFNSPGALYLATLRPSTAATSSSVASGTASLQLSPDASYAIINLSFSNLSSAEVTAHLAISTGGGAYTYVYSLPNGQVSNLVWNFDATGTYTSSDLKKALVEGRIFVIISTAKFPDSELQAQYIQNTGSTTFTAPSAPPALPDTGLTAAEAARFLTQTTFGPTQTDIDSLTGKKLADLDAWITAQMNVTQSSHRTETLADFNNYSASTTTTTPTSTNRQEAWWKISVTGQDQLRQRVAFALSELFVVSEQNSTLSNYQEALANYYDLLATNAFSNYRQLLEQVSLSPVMGTYLSHLRNQKANTTTGTQPDENYAREIMQLFSVGLVQLQPDGTLKLDSTGLPIATYDNTTITQTAKVFTGWSFYTSTPATTSFTGGAVNYLQSMTLFPNYHDNTAKTIITGKVIPANQGGLKDLADELDTLYNHPNTPPFVARRLIQHLVTSNPSPAYVYRVAQVFVDNGKGVRGDLAAVVRAVLMDYEARSTTVAAAVGYGKLKEPLLRVTALMRAFSGSEGDGRYPIASSTSNNNLGEAALDSATVFNFFDPSYVLPGSLASAGLYAPEYQILTDSTAISVANTLYTYLYATKATTTIGLDLSTLSSLAQSPDQLVDKLNVLFCGGSLSTTAHNRIVSFLKSVPATTTDTERLRSTLYLILTSPAGAIQK